MRAEDFSQELVNGLLNVLQPLTLSIILYGSVARGDASEESDVDIAVIVKGRISDELQDKLSDFVVDMNLKYEDIGTVYSEHFVNNSAKPLTNKNLLF